MASRITNVILTGTLGLAVAAGAAACGSSGHPSAAPSGTGAAPSGTSAPSTVPPTTRSPATTATTPVPATTPATADPPTTAVRTTSGPAVCASGDLGAGLSNPDGAAGHTDFMLTLTNAGASPCTLTGYPGVSYVTGNDGRQVGSPAIRTSSSTPTITLDHGQSAQATLVEADPYDYGSSCRITTVRGLRVYPPDQTAALFIPQTAKACADPQLHQLQIGAFGS